VSAQNVDRADAVLVGPEVIVSAGEALLGFCTREAYKSVALDLSIRQLAKLDVPEERCRHGRVHTPEMPVTGNNGRLGECNAPLDRHDRVPALVMRGGGQPRLVADTKAPEVRAHDALNDLGRKPAILWRGRSGRRWRIAGRTETEQRTQQEEAGRLDVVERLAALLGGR
jgi:hypothetical protein